MGTRTGSHKAAAAAIGISLADYEARLDAGERWCSGCRDFHPEADFGPDAAQGRRRVCRVARSAARRKGSK